jgi:hypothetical protein
MTIASYPQSMLGHQLNASLGGDHPFRSVIWSKHGQLPMSQMLYLMYWCLCFQRLVKGSAHHSNNHQKATPLLQQQNNQRPYFPQVKIGPHNSLIPERSIAASNNESHEQQQQTKPNLQVLNLLPNTTFRPNPVITYVEDSQAHHPHVNSLAHARPVVTTTTRRHTPCCKHTHTCLGLCQDKYKRALGRNQTRTCTPPVTMCRHNSYTPTHTHLYMHACARQMLCLSSGHTTVFYQAPQALNAHRSQSTASSRPVDQHACNAPASDHLTNCRKQREGLPPLTHQRQRQHRAYP